MAGLLAAKAKVIDGGYDPLPKQLLPDAVHGDARRQLVPWTGEPLRKLQPSALIRRNHRRGATEGRLHKAPRHRAAEGMGIAANSDSGVAGLLAVMCRVRDGGARLDVVEMHQAVVQIADLLVALGLLFFQRFATRLVRDGGKLGRQLRALLLLVSALGLEGCHGPFVLASRLGEPLLIGGTRRQFGKARGAPDSAPCIVHGFRAHEDAGQTVVVLQRDGIELVIVAAHAVERHAQKGLAHLLNLLVHHVHPQLRLVRLHDVDIAQNQEAGGDDLILAPGRAGGLHQIARNLFMDEFIERLVRIESAHHVVAVTPCLRRGHVVGRAHLVGVAHQIQPVTRPALTEGLRGEQPVHHAGKGIRRVVGHKRRDVLASRRQAGKVEARAPQQGMAVRFHRRDEAIAQQVLESSLGGACLKRLEGPVLERFLNVHTLLFRHRYGTLARIVSPLLDPLFQQTDLSRRELALGRHLQVWVLVMNGLYQEAVLRLARHQGRPVITALLPAGLGVQRQPALDLGSMRVALKAALLQQRPHLLVKQPVTFGGSRAAGSAQQQESSRRGGFPGLDDAASSHDREHRCQAIKAFTTSPETSVRR